MASPLLEFLGGKRHDVRGRSLEQMLAFSDAELEAVHDYIQWLFPLKEASAFNRDAPVLSASDAAALATSEDARAAMREALKRMLAFYGHPQVDGLHWLRRHDHNFLRITRILKSLKLAGLDEEADSVYAWLQELNKHHASVIGRETFGFWTSAVRPDARI